MSSLNDLFELRPEIFFNQPGTFGENSNPLSSVGPMMETSQKTMELAQPFLGQPFLGQPFWDGLAWDGLASAAEEEFNPDLFQSAFLNPRAETLTQQSGAYHIESQMLDGASGNTTETDAETEEPLVSDTLELDATPQAKYFSRPKGADLRGVELAKVGKSSAAAASASPTKRSARYFLRQPIEALTPEERVERRRLQEQTAAKFRAKTKTQAQGLASRLRMAEQNQQDLQTEFLSLKQQRDALIALIIEKWRGSAGSRPSWIF